MCEEARVVWLRAEPEEHWERVVAQGDRRPMADNPAAMDQLREMLRVREPAYRQAWLTVDTSGRRPAEIAREILVVSLERAAANLQQLRVSPQPLDDVLAHVAVPT